MKTTRTKKRPNVLLVVHESLGAAPLATSRGHKAAPYYHSALLSDPNFYSFNHARTVAGTTPIATPAILTGLLPYSDDGASIVRGSALAKDFKGGGYDTASFVSYGADWRSDAGGGWAILSDHLLDDFDTVVGPDETGEERVNEYGMDDRRTVKYMEKWLTERGERANNGGDDPPSPSSPFYAVLVFNNQHFPHLLHETYSGGSAEYEGSPSDPNYADYASPEARYFSSLRTMDESLRSLFENLRSSGELDNTVVMGAGDHGETPGVMKRLGDVDSVILDVPLWMYIPPGLLPERAFVDDAGGGDGSGDGNGNNGGRRDTHLRANTNRTVSTLDIVPTMRDLLGYDAPYFTAEQRSECVTGRSLLSSTLPKNRLSVGWGGAPLDSIAVGSFTMTNVGFLYYPLVDGAGPEKEHRPGRGGELRSPPSSSQSKSHVVRFRHSERDPFFGLMERPFSSLPAEDRRRWTDMLREDGWLDHPMIKRTMPDLEAFLEGNRGEQSGGGILGLASRLRFW